MHYMEEDNACTVVSWQIFLVINGGSKCPRLAPYYASTRSLLMLSKPRKAPLSTIKYGLCTFNIVGCFVMIAAMMVTFKLSLFLQVAIGNPFAVAATQHRFDVATTCVVYIPHRGVASRGKFLYHTGTRYTCCDS